VRDEGDIDTKLRDKYYASMADAKDKTPQLTQRIRSGGMDLDNTMNRLIWGGKATLPRQRQQQQGGSNVQTPTTSSGNADEGSEPKESSKASKKRKNKKSRKSKAAAIQAKMEEEKKKLVMQSLVGGVLIGAATVAITVLVGSKPK
jgi:hypothetical protein